MKSTLHILLPILSLLSLVACDSQDSECRQDMRKKLGVALYVVNTSDDGTTADAAFTPDSMSVKGLANDSVIYRTSRTSFTLPVMKSDTTTAYEIFIRHDDDANDRHISATDTLIINYDNERKFVSLECGCYILHHIHSAAATTHFTDSLQIINQTIANADETHLNIYLH